MTKQYKLDKYTEDLAVSTFLIIGLETDYFLFKRSEIGRGASSPFRKRRKMGKAKKQTNKQTKNKNGKKEESSEDYKGV